jgi:MOSC domain-containing protein YiiM
MTAVNSPHQFKGLIVAVSISDRKGIKKTNVDCGRLEPGHGLAGDAHAGAWHRQVSLLDMSSVAKVRAAGLDVQPGDFAENITTEGLDLWDLPLGTKMRLGPEALGEVTQIGKECHTRCAIYQTVGDCVMPREGIFVKVLAGGPIRPGDEIIVLPGAVDDVPPAG